MEAPGVSVAPDLSDSVVAVPPTASLSFERVRARGIDDVEPAPGALRLRKRR